MIARSNREGHRMMRRLIVSITVLFLAVVPAVATADPVRPPDGTYHYELRVAGTLSGQSTVVVHGGADDFTVDDDSRYTALNVTGHAIAHYANATLALMSYSADAVLPSGPQHADVTVAPGRMTIAVGSQHVDVAADPTAPLQILGDNFAGTTVMVPAIVTASHATRFTYVATAGAVAVPATVQADTIPARPVGILSRDAWLVIAVGNIHEVFWYDPTTTIVDAVEITEQSIEFRRVEPPGR
jgi:hypothetical protein